MEIHAPSLTPDEKQALREFFPVYEQHRHHAEAALRELVEQTGFGRLLGSVPEPSAEQQRRSLEQVRQALLDGEWPPYLAALAEQGSTYARLGVEFSEWFLLSRAFRAALTPRVHEHYVDGDRAQRALIGLNLHVDIGMETIGSAYLDTKEAIIGAQRASIQELSTPVLQVRPRLLIVPLIGVIDTHRARQLTEALLRAIRGRRARRGDGRDRRPAGRLEGGEPPHADRRRGPAHGRHRDRDRHLPRDRPDPRHHRRRAPGYPDRRRSGGGAQRSGAPPRRARSAGRRAARGSSVTSVPILQQGRTLIVALEGELDDIGWRSLSERLLREAAETRARGALIDVSRMEIIDSYAGKVLSGLADMLRLRGARTVIIGIQPAVAIAMVQLGLRLDGVLTALDLDEGLGLLDAALSPGQAHGR